MDCSPPGSSVHEISQARTLEWVAISFSRDLPDAGIKLECFALSGKFFTTEPPECFTVYGENHWKVLISKMKKIKDHPPSDVPWFLKSQRCKTGFPGGSVVKNLPANTGDAGDTGLAPGSGRSLEKEMATHSRILAWTISWTEKPGGLQSMGSQRAGHEWAHIHIL